MKRLILGALGVIIGVPVGMAFMMFLHWLSTFVYPLPEGVTFTNSDPDNMAKLNEWFGTLPAAAFLLATACHGLGCMLGATVAMLVSFRQGLIPAIVVGVIFTACGVANLSSIPHPSWFPIVDVPIYLTLAVPVGLIIRKKATNDTASETDSESQGQ